MKLFLVLLFLCGSLGITFGQVEHSRIIIQERAADSLKQQLRIAGKDTNKVNTLLALAFLHRWSTPDTAIHYGLEARNLSKQLNFEKGEIESAFALCEAFSMKGNYGTALDIGFQTQLVAEKFGDKEEEEFLALQIATVYFYSGDYQKALNGILDYYKPQRDAEDKIIQGFIGEAYFHLDKIDSAYPYIHKAYLLDKQDSIHWSIPYFYMAAIDTKKGRYKEALKNYREGITIASDAGINVDVLEGFNGISRVFKQTGERDSSILYSKNAISLAERESLTRYIIDAAALLTELYAGENTDSAYKYQKIMLAAKDSLFSEEKVKQIQNLTINEQIRQQDLLVQKQKAENKIKIYGLVAALSFVILITFFLYRNNIYKQKGYTLLERQKKDAVRQAALDRVRAEIASMRSTDDLQRITPLVWQQLKMLNVPFIRCGVFIVDETHDLVRLYLSSPEGHSLGVLKLRIDDSDFTRNSVEHWKQGKVYTLHWTREDFLNWMHSLEKLGQITDKNSFQGDVKAPESLELHIVPFKQGMVYVGNSEPLSDEDIQSVKLLAEAFAIAYARYDDFKELEMAKTKVEETLSELKSAQAQLIQSEKMASLGELTAGVAHEIQNPLNFINNFAEVSMELTEEMVIDLKEDKINDATLLSSNIAANMQKIVFHGKRADSIVKNMLQHSRKSSGLKESTDLNSLISEYMRLSYHGLRAKDKSFNAQLETDLDPTIEKVMLLPQDIGRVLLNLFNNAFYSVMEKKKLLNGVFEPSVNVRTVKSGNFVKILIRDNGMGIPEKVIDKIFQPFFTTKPTGEGTGLGLSMSFDIITKGHGGSININSKEGQYAEFEILLPV